MNRMFGRSGCGFGTTRSTQVRISVSRQSRSGVVATALPTGPTAAAHCGPTAGSTTPVVGSAATVTTHLVRILSSDLRARVSASAGSCPFVTYTSFFTKSATPLPICFWHRRCADRALAFAAGGLFGPYASATPSTVRLPEHAGAGSIRHVAVGPERSRLSLHLTDCLIVLRAALASSVVVHCADAHVAAPPTSPPASTMAT